MGPNFQFCPLMIIATLPYTVAGGNQTRNTSKFEFVVSPKHFETDFRRIVETTAEEGRSLFVDSMREGDSRAKEVQAGELSAASAVNEEQDDKRLSEINKTPSQCISGYPVNSPQGVTIAPSPATLNKFANDGSFLSKILAQGSQENGESDEYVDGKNSTVHSANELDSAVYSVGSKKRGSPGRSVDADVVVCRNVEDSFRGVGKRTRLSPANPTNGSSAAAPGSTRNLSKVQQQGSKAQQVITQGRPLDSHEISLRDHPAKQPENNHHAEGENDDDDNEITVAAKREFMRAMQIMEEAGLLTEKGIGAGMVK